jgi:hypothetical protein
VTSELFFEGDPGRDSVRRHMERVLSNPKAATLGKVAIAGAAGWSLWRLFRILRPMASKRVAADPRPR